MTTQEQTSEIKINTDFDSAENLDQITQFEAQQKILFLPLWCEGKMLLSPVQSWITIDNSWNVPLCDQNEARSCLISAQRALQDWNIKSPNERLNYLIKWIDLLNKDLYLQHFETNFFNEPQRKHLLKTFIESIRQQINFYLNSANNSSQSNLEFLFLLVNNADYELGEEQFFQDFAKKFVSQVFIAGKTLVIKPSPNLSPLMLALAELTSRIQPKLPDGVINVLHGKGEIIKTIYQNSDSEQVIRSMLLDFVTNKSLEQSYLTLINKV